MPNRIIREGICTSDTINALDPAEEVMFYRLLVVCDDFGRFDGRTSIIKAECFPLRDSVTAKQLDRWLAALVRQRLIVRYTVDGKPLLYVCKWIEHQRMRNMRSKYPAPVDDNPPSIDRELQTTGVKARSDDSNTPQSAARAGAEFESESESESEAEKTNARPKTGALGIVPPEAWERWRRHRGRKLTPEAERLQRRKLDTLYGQGYPPEAMIDLAIESGWATFYPPKSRDPPKGAPGKETLAERRTATLDAVTGAIRHERDITGTAERVDSATVHPLQVALREPGRDDVGTGGPGGPAANVG